MKYVAKLKVLFSVLVGVFMLMAGSYAGAAPLSLNGKLATHWAVQMDEPHKTTWGNELEVELNRSFGAIDLLAAWRVEHGDVRAGAGPAVGGGQPAGTPQGSESDEVRTELSEASLTWYGDDLRFDIGRQVINWGTALKINPVNVINPVDVMDPELGLVPVQSVAATFYPGPEWEVTGVWIPEFRPIVAYVPGLPVSGKPERSLENTEFAARVLHRGRGFDLSLVGFYGWDKAPYVRQDSGGAVLAFDRVLTFGAGYASSFKDVGLWTEGRYTTYPDNDDREDAVEIVLGSDYSFSNGVKLLGQVRWLDDGRNPEQTLFMTTAEGQWASIHKWRVGAMLDPDAETWYVRPELELSLADAVTLTVYAAVTDDTGQPIVPFMQHNHVGMSLAAQF